MSVGSKLLNMMILLKLRDAIDKVLREEQRGFRRGRRCFYEIFSLRLIIVRFGKYLSHQIRCVFSFTNYEEAFDSADRITVARVLSLYGVALYLGSAIALFIILDEFIKIISALYENNMLQLRYEMRLVAGFVLSQELSRVAFYPHLYGLF